MSPSASKSSSPPTPTTFEFTKRKRWADLLIHELSDAIIFILSSDAKIWFCGRAVSELLGWSGAELIDCSFTDLVNREPSLDARPALHPHPPSSSRRPTRLPRRLRRVSPHPYRDEFLRSSQSQGPYHPAKHPTIRGPLRSKGLSSLH